MAVIEQPPALTGSELDLLDAWWRAANYLSVGQISLMANPLLTEPLRPEHVKPRLLGTWGTTPANSARTRRRSATGTGRTDRRSPK